MLHKYFWMLHFLSPRFDISMVGSVFFGKHYIKVDLFLHFLSISLEVESDAMRFSAVGVKCVCSSSFSYDVKIKK